MSSASPVYRSNEVCHFDVSGPNLEALKGFYEKVFGWHVNVQGPGYALVETPAPQLSGAIIDSDEHSLTIGVTVNDLDAALLSATKAGGSVVMPRTDNGWVVKGQVEDPAGNRVTLIQK